MIYSRIISSIKQKSNVTLKAWIYQCESILAQRSRRIQQLFTFYHHVYGTQGLKILIRSYHRHLPPFKGKNLVLSAASVMGISLTGGGNYDWGRERLSLANFDKCQRDVEFIETLSKNKLCPLCKEKSMKYCYCLIGNKLADDPGKPLISTYRGGGVDGVDGGALMGKSIIENDSVNPWQPYFSKDQFSIWKRDEEKSMCSYKVYASFKDISAADFLHVQTDLDYRKEWDDTAVVLKLIEEDPDPGNNSHLIYWEMQWPKFFANRDYVYCRRFITDDKRKVIMIANRGTCHPRYPEMSGKVRVNTYWSLMVIKPFQGFHEPGLHYVLTYFDDPGVPIPQGIKNWVTQRQMPDFLQKLYHATKQYSYRRALAMKAVFHSLTKMNKEYSANASRENWIKRLWRNSNHSFPPDSSTDD